MDVPARIGAAVLREIVIRHPAGADEELIRGGVSARDGAVVDDQSLRAALERLWLAGLVRPRRGRWHATPGLLAELPGPARESPALSAEAFRAFTREHVDRLFDRNLRDEVKHGGVWHPTEEMRGAEVVYEAYDEARDMLAVVFAKRGLFRAALCEKSRDHRQWPMVWGEHERDSWFPTRDAAIAHATERLESQPIRDE